MAEQESSEMITAPVTSDTDTCDDYTENEKYVYRKIPPIYRQMWVNCVLSTVRFILESVPLAWTAYKSLKTDPGTLTTDTSTTKNESNNTHTVPPDWMFSHSWVFIWIMLALFWLIAAIQVFTLREMQRWRPGAGQEQLRGIILSLIHAGPSLPVIMALNCFELLFAVLWSVFTWKEYLHGSGCPTKAGLDADPIIGLLITPWTVLVVAILFTGQSCRSKMSRLTKKFIKPAVPAQLLI